MARIPKGGGLIDNPVSNAPGFVIENVDVMAGVPKIMQAMENILPMLKGGEQLSSITVSAQVPEGQIAAAMGALQGEYEDVNLGLYPFYDCAGPVSWRVPAIRHALARLRPEQSPIWTKSVPSGLPAPKVTCPNITKC